MAASIIQAAALLPHIFDSGGLTIAVLLDATVVRLVLLPALMLPRLEV
jgi:uncharacterized membrane protein YdfJ with MMPL/SSD domain